MQDLAARKALIIKLANNYDWSSSNFTKGQLDAMLEATADCSLEGLATAIEQFMAGRVSDHNNARMPSGAELAVKARLYAPAEPRIPLFNGVINSDWGHGAIDLRGLTREQQDRVERLPKTVEGHYQMRALAAQLRVENSDRLGIPFGHPTERITNDVPKSRLKRI